MQRNAERLSSSCSPILASSVGWRREGGHGPAVWMPLSSSSLVRLTAPSQQLLQCPAAPVLSRVLLLLLLPPAMGTGWGHISVWTGDGGTATSCGTGSPRPRRQAGDGGGCMGTGAQECCFFHPGFRQGSKSALQKAFVSLSTLLAAVPASPCLACWSQDAAILAHTPRACSGIRVYPGSVRLGTHDAKGSNHITSHLPCAPSMGTGSMWRALSHPTPHRCIPPIAIPSVLEAVPLSHGRRWVGTKLDPALQGFGVQLWGPQALLCLHHHTAQQQVLARYPGSWGGGGNIGLQEMGG